MLGQELLEPLVTNVGHDVQADHLAVGLMRARLVTPRDDVSEPAVKELCHRLLVGRDVDAVRLVVVEGLELSATFFRVLP